MHLKTSRWRFFRVAAPGIAVIGIAALNALSQEPAPRTVELSGKVVGASGKHSIYVALWDAPGFLEHPVHQVRFEPQADPAFHFRVPPGRWAVSAFEDQNENGVLDMGTLGPKEPSGFWLPFHHWRKPRFDDVASHVERDAANISIRIGK